MRRAHSVTLNTAQRRQLSRYARGRQVAVRLALRARIVLLAADSLENKQIAAQLGVSRQLVARWRRRFLEHGIPGIEKDAPRPGRKPAVSPETVQEIIRKTTCEKPPNATHWSRRTMAAAAGVSASTVGRLWPQAPSRQDLQAQQRPAFRRETRRHRRTLSEPARACSGSLAR